MPQLVILMVSKFVKTGAMHQFYSADLRLDVEVHEVTGGRLLQSLAVQVCQLSLIFLENKITSSSYFIGLLRPVFGDDVKFGICQEIFRSESNHRQHLLIGRSSTIRDMVALYVYHT